MCSFDISNHFACVTIKETIKICAEALYEIQKKEIERNASSLNVDVWKREQCSFAFMDMVVSESKLAFLINVLKDNIYRIAHMLGFKN